MPAIQSPTHKDSLPSWVHLAVTVVLLVIAAALDLTRPFDKTFSICYLLPVMYAGWALQDRAELLVYAATLMAAFAVPPFRAPDHRTRPFSLNRSMGVGVGLLVIGLMRERRRYSSALVQSKGELEDKVRERTAELQQLNEEYQHLVAVKGQFLSNMSHEIRTPLNGIVGMADLLAATRLDEEQRAILRDLRTSGQTLRTIVDDILDLARIEAGRIEVDQAPFSIRAIVDEMAAIIRPEALLKGIAVHTATPAPLDSVSGDRTRVRQVLTNLAGNALKFTEQGFVRIEVTCADTAPGAVTLRFAVEDSGIGISPQEQQRIFEKYTQIDASTTRRYGGSGLGLAISKDLVALMGGAIGVDSTPGRGSTFWFTLPLLLAHPTAAAPAPALSLPEPPAVPCPARVAIVEDTELNRRLAARFLERLGCSVSLASNGREALELMADRSFDIVFMDCHMPEMDGLETTRAIRRGEAGRAHRTVIVAMTASVLDGEREACLAAGMDDFLAKPVGFEDMRQALLRWSPENRNPVKRARTAGGV